MKMGFLVGMLILAGAVGVVSSVMVILAMMRKLTDFCMMVATVAFALHIMMYGRKIGANIARQDFRDKLKEVMTTRVAALYPDSDPESEKKLTELTREMCLTILQVVQIAALAIFVPLGFVLLRQHVWSDGAYASMGIALLVLIGAAFLAIIAACMRTIKIRQDVRAINAVLEEAVRVTNFIM